MDPSFKSKLTCASVAETKASVVLPDGPNGPLLFKSQSNKQKLTEIPERLKHNGFPAESYFFCLFIINFFILISEYIFNEDYIFLARTQ